MDIAPRNVLFHDPNSHTMWDRTIGSHTYRFLVEPGRRATAWRINSWGDLAPVHHFTSEA